MSAPIDVRARRGHAAAGVRAGSHDARALTVEGVVQGVGFRPFVWRLATELGLAGRVRNAAGRVEIEAAGTGGALDAFARRLRTDAPPRARVERVSWAAARSGRRGRPPVALRDRRERRRRGRGPALPAGHRDLRRVPRGARRSCRPALPVPVHELHELRAAGHDHRRAALRPRPDHDARVPAVRRLRGRVRGPGEPPLPRRARGLPGLRAPAGVPPDRRPGPDRARRGGPRGRGRGPAGRNGRRGQGPGRLPPRLRRHGRDGRRPPARPEASLGEALRDHGPRPRGRPGALPRDVDRGRAPGGAGAADRAPRRAAPRHARAGAVRGRRESPPRDLPAVHAAPSPAPGGGRSAARAHLRQPDR